MLSSISMTVALHPASSVQEKLLDLGGIAAAPTVDESGGADEEGALLTLVRFVCNGQGSNAMGEGNGKKLE
jgi:hypothetical protein